MSLGRLTKKASSTFDETSVCHIASTATPTAICQNRTAGPKGPALRDGARVGRILSDPALPSLAFDDFIAKHCPDQAIEIHERRQRPDFEQIARARDRYGMDRDD